MLGLTPAWEILFNVRPCLMLGLTSAWEILFNVRPYFCLRDLV